MHVNVDHGVQLVREAFTIDSPSALQGCAPASILRAPAIISGAVGPSVNLVQRQTVQWKVGRFQISKHTYVSFIWYGNSF